VVRHSVLWLLRDTTTPEQQLNMLKGLAYVRMECAGVVAGDYGADLFGGSSRLREVKPWERTPRWRARHDGPPCNFDVTLHLDFNDWAGFEAYGPDPAHTATAAFNDSVSWDELTARVDWRYDGEPMMGRGLVRHAAMFVWADDVNEILKRGTLDAVQRLQEAPGVQSVTIAHNAGGLATNFDWMLDVQLTDRDATERLLNGQLYTQLMQTVALATKYEWTARISHVMRGL
jgi:hypothetical protein